MVKITCSLGFSRSFTINIHVFFSNKQQLEMPDIYLIIERENS